MRWLILWLTFLSCLAFTQTDRFFSAQPSTTLPTALTPTLEAPAETPFEKGQEKMKEKKEKAREEQKEEEKEKEKELQPFGFDFFEQAPEAFAPPPEAPIPPSYRLAPEDLLTLTVFSSLGQQTTYPLKVDHQGKVYIPIAGKMHAADLTLSELEEKVEKVLKPRYPQLGLYLTLEKTHPIKVFVTGEARRPGGYILSGVSTVLNALFSAGGPNERGSMRSIHLIRRGKTIATIDLYAYLLYGEEKFEELQSGDTLFIPVVGSQVAIRGEVKREAIFELKNEKTLAQVLEMAGGLKPTADIKHIQVTRAKENKEKILIDVDPESMDRFQVFPGDEIQVFPILERSENIVAIEGKVEKPGDYAFTGKMTVKDLVEKAGGILKTEPVYMERADIFRLNDEGRTIMRSFSLKKALDGDPEQNLPLQPLDRLVIYSPEEAIFLDQTVSVQGAVKVPGVYPRTEGMRVLDALHLAGGILPEAADEVEIASANTEKNVLIQTLSLKSIFARGKDNILLHDRDVITVKKKGQFLRRARTVRIDGEVKYPGTYALESEEDTLYDLLQRAGGPTPQAFLKGAVFNREKRHLTQKDQEKTIQQITETLNYLLETQYDIQLAQFGVQRTKKESEIVIPTAIPSEELKAAAAVQKAKETLLEKNLGEELSAEKLIGVGKPRKLEAEEATTRVALDLQKIVETQGKEGNIKLKSGDHLYIPPKPLTVSVVGAVVNPSHIFYVPDQGIKYYIEKSGGFTEEANKRKIIVISANGEITPQKEVKEIERGDVIIVPPQPILVKQKKSAFERFQDILQVVANAATGVLTIIALKNIGK